MIFKIADGRTCFYQWDIDRQLIVSDPTIKEVHFCNRTDDCSLVVPVEDGVAHVPNKLLQSGYAIRVFGYDGKATLHEATFEVKARTRPADYVYTEEQEYTIEYYLAKAIDEAKANGEFNGDKGDKGDKGDQGEPGAPFTYDMFTEEQLEALRGPEGKQGPTGPQGPKGDQGIQGEKGDPGETPSLEGYATEQYVQDAIANIDIPEGGGDVDLSNYYTKEETYSKTEVDSLISEPEKSYILKFQEGNSKAITDEATLEFLNLVYDTGKVPLAHLSLEIVGQSRVLTITDVEWDRTYNQIVFSTYSYLAANQNDLLIDTVKVNRSTAGTWTSSWTDRRLTYTTKSYVTTAIQNALNAIGVAEGGAY